MKLVINTILLLFSYFMIVVAGAIAIKPTGPNSPQISLGIGVFFIVCCVLLWIWRNRLKQEKVSIIRSPILWWKSQPVYSNFLLILLPIWFSLVMVIALSATGFLLKVLSFLLGVYSVASVLYLSWDLLVKRKLHKKPVFWGVIGVLMLIMLIIYLPPITGTGTGSSNNYAACSQYGSKNTVEERIRSLGYKLVSISLNSERDCRYQWTAQVIDNGNNGWCAMTTDGTSGSVEIVSATCN